ncbi:MAG: hypothetical protein FXF49_06235 [Flexistipes sinusarabici]|uniref:Uncharacterized protein n=1 Tax=Flexistipes sinusarabici TaxID=2352 RepID=A0A5D0MKJ1_FLESI|nr:hypothetical protein [Flexistipes sinusarabici]TYB33506.1 MAG: hypothetical protein FXF49_06235 [Flexistipes sinusarabici]
MTETEFKEIKISFPPIFSTSKTEISDNKNNLDIFPLFVDYDFELLRPRGVSTRIDFFSLGKLTEFLENTDKINSIVYIKKSEFYLDNGFFLMDFKHLNANYDLFAENIHNLRFDKIYLEKSEFVKHQLFENKLDEVSVFFVEFI